ncbi:MAG: shikimate kinase [Desulfosporosinus sp.]|jgi:shikimate kinase
MRNIVLIGFMGTGKSTVGKRLAQSLAWDFYDTDYLIAEITNLSVSEIFKRHGETRFRSEESIVVTRLSQQERIVIATGGGTVLNPQNREALARNGIVICLHASLDAILSRIGHKNDRPLLRGPKEEIEKLWLERQKYYSQADFTVDTSEKSIDEVVNEILAWLERMDISEYRRDAKD